MNSKILRYCVFAVVTGLLVFLFNSTASCQQRPNIVLIMVDDMGFSDLGCYGGEIQTPNLDALAHNGIRFTQFYNCAKCETTRATLLSGQYYPEVDNTQLNNCITIAEGMKAAGYQTIMTGKWHVKGSPLDFGFDRYFGHLSGATNFFVGDGTFRIGKEKFNVPESGFYTTDANTDYAIQFLKESNPEEPFFLYIAHNAPHYPLQAPKKDVEKYLNNKTYNVGWDQIRERRFRKQIELGLFPSTTKHAQRPRDVPAWEALSAKDKQRQILMMSTFAAMVDRVDQNLGRLVNHLKQSGQLDNTLILFWSDNGACPFQRTRKPTLDSFNDPNIQTLMPWNPKSYWVYDKGWAHACNTPFREYKQNQHEGGICTPLIAHWPKLIQARGEIVRQPGHLVDIMTTCFDLASFKYPKHHKGQEIGEARGRSLTPIFKGETREPHPQIFQSFYGKNNALRVGEWKIVNKDRNKFELYNIVVDRTEQNDLSKSNPEKFREMKQKLETEFQRLGVKVKMRNNKKQQ